MTGTGLQRARHYLTVKGACHWFPSRFETSVQQSILHNFQGCQQRDQVCIRKQSPAYIFNQERKFFPLSFSLSLCLFFFYFYFG